MMAVRGGHGGVHGEVRYAAYATYQKVYGTRSEGRYRRLPLKPDELQRHAQIRSHLVRQRRVKPDHFAQVVAISERQTVALVANAECAPLPDHVQPGAPSIGLGQGRRQGTVRAVFRRDHGTRDPHRDEHVLAFVGVRNGECQHDAEKPHRQRDHPDADRRHLQEPAPAQHP